jgi:hypothetical protein
VGDNLISVPGVDHLALDNHVALIIQAWRRLGGIVSLPKWRQWSLGQSAGSLMCRDVQ